MSSVWLIGEENKGSVLDELFIKDATYKEPIRSESWSRGARFGLLERSSSTRLPKLESRDQLRSRDLYLYFLVQAI